MTAQKRYIDYYPFGLQTSSSWTRENSNNDFLYNEGSELNKTTGWYETPFRNYDAALGRLTSVDPMATKYASFSGYHYAYNNPVMSNDPSGADPESDLQTQFSYMVAMEKLRQELADMARKAFLEQNPFYDGPLDPGPAAAYFGMLQEAERQNEAALLARARSGDMQAIREYASTHGGLVRYEGAEARALFNGLYAMEEAKLGRRAPAGPPTPSGGAQQGGPGDPSKWKSAWDSYWWNLADALGLHNDIIKRGVGVIIIGSNGQKVQLDYSTKGAKNKVVGVLNLNENDNLISVLSMLVISNELDAVATFVNIEQQDPRNQFDKNGFMKYYPIPGYPGYFTPGPSTLTDNYYHKFPNVAFKYAFDGYTHNMIEVIHPRIQKKR